MVTFLGHWNWKSFLMEGYYTIQIIQTCPCTSIAYQELFPVVLAASFWSQKHILFCDDEAIDKSMSRSPLMEKLLR